MVVRIRFANPPTPGERRERNQRLALAFAVLLQALAVSAFMLAVWGAAANLQVLGSFAFASGLLSHWQTWVAAAAAIWWCAHALNRFGRSGGQTAV